MYKQDFHLHSKFSPDSSAEPAEIIKEAEKKGLNHIIFTEHCEANLNQALPDGKPLWPPLDIEKYTSEISELKKTAPLKIGIGLELGQATFAPKAADEALEAYDWDIVLGSMHNIKNGVDFYYMNYKNEDINKLTRLYLEDLYNLAVWNKFDVLSHLYYHLRYIYRQGLELDIRKYEAEIRDIFRLLIINGKGIELNTASLDDAFGDVIPGLYYLKIYHEMGGEIITVGSDGHRKDRVGFGSEYALDLLSEAGFKAIASFEKRKINFIDI